MSVSAELLCSFELLKPLDSSALKSHIKKGRNKRNSMLNSPVSFCCHLPFSYSSMQSLRGKLSYLLISIYWPFILDLNLLTLITTACDRIRSELLSPSNSWTFHDPCYILTFIPSFICGFILLLPPSAHCVLWSNVHLCAKTNSNSCMPIYRTKTEPTSALCHL